MKSLCCIPKTNVICQVYINFKKGNLNTYVTWMNFEDIKLKQMEKDKYQMIPLT